MAKITREQITVHVCNSDTWKHIIGKAAIDYKARAEAAEAENKLLQNLVASLKEDIKLLEADLESMYARDT